ncbi:alkaline shock response membrane anchor protein AmaP [Streptomyces sp. GC420]|uniref:alkaline shock response membrane anchor protein AmaP n=1 Tax=Streptomyces sp. GC420 TaxID=2697568 RepID=UPI0014152F2D|nr:alkaline shock response membrane anchor protein AmaP [Streptomyces sp. GC420]NBM14796.1 alkaline shock response membrane anchor protein AmaP [Streptomyces sp. GC420]
MNRRLKVCNRLLTGLAGLVLVLLGGAVLAAGAGADVPSWWPFDGHGDVLLADEDRGRWRDEGWWWPAVISVLALLVLLALWWLLAQFRRHRLGEVLVDSGDGEGARLRGKALEGALTRELGDMEGVRSATARLTGRRTAPRVGAGLVLEPYARPAATLRELTDHALAHARDSAGLAALPAEVRLREARHRARRVL